MATPGARSLAWEVLLAVDTRRAYADLALNAVLGQHAALPARERALATELSYGTVRRLNTIDWALGLCSRRPLGDCDARVRAALRVGSYQLLYLPSIPPPVAVHETVALLGRRHRAGAGFVNAVLRRLAGMAGRLPFPDRDRDPVGRLALEHSHPEWMVTVVMERLGAAETEDWCRANNQPAPLTVRVNRLRTSVERFTAELDRAGIAWRPGHYYEYAVELLRPGPLDAVPGFEQGHFLVQDEASMLVAAVLDPRAGERVLDACAAPGGKATHLAELMDDQGLVLANDARAARVQLIHENRKRLALHCMEVRTGDARELGEVYPAHFHRVLVDAPCSGLGVLARRPDARWRRQPADVEALARLQYELLVASARCVRPGGTLVYSVCTLTPAEGQGVIDAFLATEAQFCLEPSTGPLDPALFAQALPGGVLELWPHRHGTDGFFVARLVRST